MTFSSGPDTPIVPPTSTHTLSLSIRFLLCASSISVSLLVSRLDVESEDSAETGPRQLAWEEVVRVEFVQETRITINTQ